MMGEGVQPKEVVRLDAIVFSYGISDASPRAKGAMAGRGSREENVLPQPASTDVCRADGRDDDSI